MTPRSETPSEFLRVHYDLQCGPGERPEEKARQIAQEQTVELPEGRFSAALAAEVVGRVEELVPLGASDLGQWSATVAYAPEVTGWELPQFLNLLFGNISLKAGIRVRAIDWPPSFLARFRGPRFGSDGLRGLCGLLEPRPLVCAALKPMGLSASELAGLCRRFALGGADVVKDDHGLADQAWAPFRERVERCQEAVAAANAQSGGATLYFPNLTAPHEELEKRIEAAQSAGCRGGLIAPLLVGVDAVRALSESSELALLGHPALSGAFFTPGHGIAPEVLLGEIFRLAGCDGVIYPNAGGRFPFAEQTCAAINVRLRRPLRDLRPAMPVPAGGMDVARVSHWIEVYGPDIMVLIGGSLYEEADLTAATRALVARVRGAIPA